MAAIRFLLLIFFLFSAGALAIESAPQSQPVGSAGFDEMLGKQLGTDSLKTEALTDGSFKLTNTVQTLSAHVTPQGVIFDSIGSSSGKGGFGLSLVQWGRDGNLQETQSSKIYSENNNVYHAHTDGITEKFSNTSSGIRQDFIVAAKLEGKGSLHVQLQVSGGKVQSKNTSLQNTGATIVLESGRKLTYDRLAVTDSAGKNIPAQIIVASHDRIDVIVDDAAASYPLTIDPTVGDENWVSVGRYPGSDSYVSAIVIRGNNIYVACGPIMADVRVNYIAKWNGSSWSALGSGVSSFVNALAIDSSGNVYAGGVASAGGLTVNGVAKWNGSSWSALGSGFGGGFNNSYGIATLQVDADDNLYAGGNFTTTDGVAANHIAKWNGSNWSALGSGMSGLANTSVQTMVIDSNGDLYAGGAFTSAGGVAANYIAKWDGSNWSALGSGVTNVSNPKVDALVLDSNGMLYAGGLFTTAGGVAANYIAKWNGSVWSALGSGTNAQVLSLQVDAADNIYVGGFFTSAVGVANTSYIARWNGSAWSVVSGGAVNGYVQAMAFDSDGTLYTGGGFTKVGNTAATYIAKWNGGVWSALTIGIDGKVYALAVDGNNNLYVGGEFTSIGDIAANYIAKWDGSAWSALGSGIAAGSGYSVKTLAIDSSDNLYVGGVFNNAGGISLINLAKWDGSNWSAVSGLGPATINALIVDNSDHLYVGGQFTKNGSRNVVKWNGSSWIALGTGVDNRVRALAVDNNNNLYVGGEFLEAGGLAANFIAKWNGSVWSAVDGLNAYVYALASDDNGNVYAGGDFWLSVDGALEEYIAKWNGTSWSVLGAGVNNSVKSLAIDADGALYAGGLFSQADGSFVSRVARWDGAVWSALGGGISNNPNATAVNSLAVDNRGALFAGGDFHTAGDKVSPYLAQWFQDTDGDDSGNSVDADDDNDSVLDVNDAFPLNASESVDTDNDGTGNNADTDDDNDSVADVSDPFPLDANRWLRSRHNADLDNDSDILVRSASTGAWSSYAVQNAAITGNTALSIPTNSDTQYIAQLDANGDGDADVLTRSVSTGAWTIYQIQNGTVIASAPIYLYANLDWHFVGAGDLNGNGTDDVLLRSTSSGLYNSFLINNYAVATVNAFNAWSSSASVDQGIGDFDGDGSDDLLIRRTTENAWFVFRSVNGLVENYYCACNLWYNPDWTFQFAGDTNKDGIDDIAVRGTGASGDGLWWAFRMNNFVSTQTTNLNLFVNKTAVTLGAVGDYNGDGTVDVLTRVNGATTYVSPITNGLVTGNNWLQNFTTDQVIGK